MPADLGHVLFLVQDNNSQKNTEINFFPYTMDQKLLLQQS